MRDQGLVIFWPHRDDKDFSNAWADSQQTAVSYLDSASPGTMAVHCPRMLKMCPAPTPLGPSAGECAHRLPACTGLQPGSTAISKAPAFDNAKRTGEPIGTQTFTCTLVSCSEVDVRQPLELTLILGWAMPVASHVSAGPLQRLQLACCRTGEPHMGKCISDAWRISDPSCHGCDIQAHLHGAVCPTQPY